MPSLSGLISSSSHCITQRSGQIPENCLVEYTLIQIVNQNNEISFTSGWAKFLGMPLEELSSDIWFENCIHPEDHHYVSKCIKKTIPHQFEARYKRKDGEYRWFLTGVTVNPMGRCATSVDITEKKEYENRHIEDNEFFQILFDSLHAYICYVDHNLVYKYTNHAYKKDFGKNENIIGKTVKQVMGENLFLQAQQYIERALKGEDVKYETNHADQHISITLVPHREDSHNVIGIFVLIQPPPQNIANSYFSDLERFMSYWKESPKDMVTFMGRVLGRIGFRQLPNLFFSFGAAYYAYKNICERIDYLYSHGSLKKYNLEAIGISTKQSIVCLKDNTGIHDNVNMMLIRDTVDNQLFYSIRLFQNSSDKKGKFLTKHFKKSDLLSFSSILGKLDEPSHEQQYKDDPTFWNFQKPENVILGVTIYPNSHAFYNLEETKSVADMIVLASNLCGYR